MTNYQKQQYEIRYKLDNYQCFCGMPAIQMSHRISQSKMNYKIYGKEIIEHNFNLRSVCNTTHNDMMNIGFNPNKCDILVKLIRQNKDRMLSSKDIDFNLEGN